MTDIQANQSADRRRHLFQAYAHAASIMRAISVERLEDPTPCPEWNIATLIDHTVGVGWRAVTIGRGDTIADEDFPHIELLDAPEQLTRAGTEAMAVWTKERLSATTTMPWGETYDGEKLVDMYLAELVAHSWDLTVAIESAPDCDEELAQAALEGALGVIRPEHRDVMGRGHPFGAQKSVDEDAPTLERFVAFMGRDAAWRSEHGSTSA
jgi:uncharacterized protein (TIGR03086 family)